MSQDEKTFEGQCYCGAVKIVVTGRSRGAGYCHCAACRSWSAGPVNAFTLWKPEAIEVTQGERTRSASTTRTSGPIGSGARSAAAICWRGTRSGAWSTSTRRPSLVSISPGVHVNYESAVLRMQDGLPKLKDFPAELGGSGEAVPE